VAFVETAEATAATAVNRNQLFFPFLIMADHRQQQRKKEEREKKERKKVHVVFMLFSSSL